MRVPYGWLTDYVEVDCDPYRLAETLTMVGVNVEAVIDETLDIQGVVAGHVQSVAPHPHRSSLRVATVSVGDGQLEIVSGAHVERGWCVVVAVPGAVLVGDWRIEKAAVAGVISEGMLLSATELLYGEPHLAGEGLLVLPGSVEVGACLKSIYDLDDKVFELDLTPNYGHCLSLVGVAREVAAAAGGRLMLPPITEDGEVEESPCPIELSISDARLCWRYVAKLVNEVTVGFSPLPLQRRLQLAGMRPLNNVVDATNYTMLELGQPLHAFDQQRLVGRIDVRRAQTDETIVTLDGKKRVLSRQDLIIADQEGPVAIAGVMGGLDSEVTLTTQEVLLESAYFSPLSVRRTATRLGLRSEASARFERGVDPLAQAVAAQRCAVLLAQTAGGRPQQGVLDLWKTKPCSQRIALSSQRVNAVLGSSLSPRDICDLLSPLGFTLQDGSDEGWQVIIPSYRPDISQEIDLVEEVARAHGYNRIDATLPQKTAAGDRTQKQRRKEVVGDYLLACGLDEAVTYPLVDSKRALRLGIDEDDILAQQVKLANPLSAEQDALRNAIFPGLLDVLSFNRKRQVEGARIFEIGNVFFPVRQERLKAGVCAFGRRAAPHWRSEGEMVDFFWIKGIFEGLCERLGLDWCLDAQNLRWLHPWRQAQAFIGQRHVASWGQLHPVVARRWDLPDETVVLEVELGLMLSLAEKAVRFEALPRYPAAQRDLALLVPEGVRASQVVEVIKESAPSFLDEVVLFDEYRGEQLPPGYRSLAYTVTYRKHNGTLTEEEIADATTQVAACLAQRLKAEIR